MEQAIITSKLNNLVEKMNEAKNQSAGGTTPQSRDLIRQASWDSKPSTIKNLYQNILQMLEEGPLANLRKLGNKENNSLIDVSSFEGYNIILITWKSVFNLLTSKSFTFLFSVGIADNFNYNYKETICFLNSLSNLFETQEVNNLSNYMK